MADMHCLAVAATTVGGYALFSGGGYGLSAVDAYDKSLTRSTPTELSSAKTYHKATTIGVYALFAGGTSSDVVEVYTPT